MYFLCVIRQKERKSFFLLHLLTNAEFNLQMQQNSD